MYLYEAMEGFKFHLVSKERSVETIKGYWQVLTGFKAYIESVKGVSVHVGDINLEDLEGYLFYRKGEGDQAVSRNRALYIFRSFYTYLDKRDLISRNISRKLEPIKFQQKERIYLTGEELEELIDAIDHPLIKVGITTLSYTGLRVSELCNLTLDDVDLDNKMLKVINGKGNKDRIIPINDSLNYILQDYLDFIRPNVTSDRFLATEKTGKISPQYINLILKKTTRKLGWDKHITAHIIRHSFASNLVKNNASLPSIQSLLGHSDLRVTSRYIHQNLEELQMAVNLIQFKQSTLPPIKLIDKSLIVEGDLEEILRYLPLLKMIEQALDK